MPKTPPAEPPAPKPRVGRARPIADLVGDIGGQAFRRFGFTHAALIERWPEIVGPAFARHCRPLRLRLPRGEKSGGTLAIAATSAVAPMLRHVEAQLIERANRILGHAAIARLAIEQGEVMAPPPAPPPPDGVIADATRSTLKDIADPELRATLESLAQALAGSSGPPRIR
ncbi:DUF721 domain-containing protein [Sandarakinorhabdus rubra]|uniref:DUF721 domain-containing protein n=1 Tax=Sandarakinorhabdus rubra TaxID=2672568 RepID=UPI0013D9F2BE|nr:DUF721 domain-containing protein [Sandarakinorhabdus rubra]